MITGTIAYRAGAALAVWTALLLVYGIGALGVIGAAGDPADLLYLGVFGVGLVGALVARFRPRGMAITMLATALAQALVTVDALVLGLGGSNPRLEIVGLNAMFVVLEVAAAWLFHRSEQPGGVPASQEA